MSLYTVRSGVSNHPEDSFLQQLTDLVQAGGVVSLSDDHYLVTEPSGGGLNVDVATGRAYVKGVGNAYPIRNTATETVSINANSSGNPRITSVVARVNLSATPGANDEGDDVHDIIAVDGTPASSPQSPSDGAIQSAVGGSSPWIRLADVVVAHGATGISNTNITDTRQRVYFKSSSSLLSVDYSSTYSHDYSLTNQLQMVLTGNLTLNAPTNMEVGDFLLARLVQDGSGGRTLTLGSGLNSKSPDLSLASGASESTSVMLHKVSNSAIDVYLVGKDY